MNLPHEQSWGRSFYKGVDIMLFVDFLIDVKFVAFCYFYCGCDCKRFNKMKKNRKSLRFYDRKLQIVRIIARKVISL